MSKSPFLSVGVALAVILSALSLYVSMKDAGMLGATSRTQSAISADDITARDDLFVTDDATVSGGSLVVTTSNTATSTIIGGCFQFYATSTATAQKFMASTTPGVMYSQYGTCP